MGDEGNARTKDFLSPFSYKIFASSVLFQILFSGLIPINKSSLCKAKESLSYPRAFSRKPRIVVKGGIGKDKIMLVVVGCLKQQK
jgi:hypothetical protein